MRTARRSWAAGIAALALLSLTAPGCGKKPGDGNFLPNVKPTVRLTHAPVTTDSRNTYAYRMNWVGFDEDGRVDHFVYAIDPPNVDVVDSNWVETTKNEEVVFFRATQPDSAGVPRLATDPHVFAIRAVDDRGEESATASRAFFSFTVAPSVNIIEPRAGNFTPIVTPSVRIKWEGRDPDGVFTQKPIKYKFKLFRKVNPDYPDVGRPDFVAWAISNPDSFRRLYAPTFPGWDSTSAETTEFQYTNLQPDGQYYLFVVTGFDEAGAYDPIFSQTTNMLRFVVTFAGTLGPKICMFNEFFNYCYATGGYVSDPSRYYVVEVPAGQPVTFNWFAEPDPGAAIRSYRWVLDLVDLRDETPRSNPLTDWRHWSARSLNTTSATIGPFADDNQSHNFFIEAEDNNGLRSLGIINFTPVQSTLDRNLLLVDDTRLTPDETVPGNPNEYRPPSGQWPTASELDSLFFAKGGFPWRNYPGQPPSRRGIFDGYDYDTTGTRGRWASGIVPLSMLGNYAHVIWYTDGTSASYSSSPLDATSPITSLRLMSSPGFPSTLSTYIKQGGLVWLFGGGSAAATLIPWNRRPPSHEYTETDLELVPGRFMWDFAHWRSKVVTPLVSNRFVLHAPGNVPGVPTFFNDPATIPSRGWRFDPPRQIPPPPAPVPVPVTEPNWSGLPLTLDLRSQASASEDPDDAPVPPRTASIFSNAIFTEFLGQANFIREDIDNDPQTAGEESKLDTLYFAAGRAVSVPARPFMTIYRGHETMPIVFTGIPIWYLRRTHEIALVDFVLGDLWRMPKPSRTSSVRASRAPRE